MVVVCCSDGDSYGVAAMIQPVRDFYDDSNCNACAYAAPSRSDGRDGAADWVSAAAGAGAVVLLVVLVRWSCLQPCAYEFLAAAKGCLREPADANLPAEDLQRLVPGPSMLAEPERVSMRLLRDLQDRGARCVAAWDDAGTGRLPPFIVGLGSRAKLFEHELDATRTVRGNTLPTRVCQTRFSLKTIELGMLL